MSDSKDLPVTPGGAAHIVLEELAEDMLRVLERLSRIEGGQAQTLSYFEQMAGNLTAGIASMNRVVEGVRRDFLAERKALAIRDVAGQVAPALESLSCMRDGLDADADSGVRSQLRSITTMLENLMTGMGLQPFTPRIGDPFDPQRMESAGYADGPQGAVIQVIHGGYLAGQVVLRPASVLLGKSSPESPDSTGTNKETR